MSGDAAAVVGFEHVYVATTADSAAAINAKLGAGLHVVLSPGIYDLEAPLKLGTKGQVLLAHSAPDVIEGYLTQNLESLTPYTITDPEELRPVLAKIQKDGYAVTVSDVQVFAGSMSAPVFDRHGELAGGVCFVMLKSVIEDSGRRDALLEALLQTSQAISMGLGWRPGSTAASNQ